jgi:hypothetical protein
MADIPSWGLSFDQFQFAIHELSLSQFTFVTFMGMPITEIRPAKNGRKIEIEIDPLLSSSDFDEI